MKTKAAILVETGKPLILDEVEMPALKNGQNAANALARAERVNRCRQAVGLQAGGATRKQIAEQLGVSALVVKSLLRDGKFYANPRSDPDRII